MKRNTEPFRQSFNRMLSREQRLKEARAIAKKRREKKWREENKEHVAMLDRARTARNKIINA